MRILASNPDNIGDLILRQPMYAALQAAGHELLLVVRPLVLPLMPLIAPGAQVRYCEVNSYELGVDWAPAQPLFKAAKAFAPEMLLVAPYQWTALEERLAAALPGVPVMGMSGLLYPGDIRGGMSATSELVFDRQVEVAEDLPETRKNELLASAVLGRSPKLPAPRLTPTVAHVSSAQTILQRLGLSPNDYWVACVGDDRYNGVRNWRPEAWRQVLSTWAHKYGRNFLLVGSDAETTRCQETIAGMDEPARRHMFLLGRAQGLDTLAGLLSLAQGYVGRDTGPMHLAAALGKPVLAVFGGGHWPRFVPAATSGCALTVTVPCSGCNWVCHLPASYCVKAVPTDHLLQAIGELEAGRLRPFEVRAEAADATLQARMVRESALAVRQHMFRLGQAEHHHEAMQAFAGQRQQLLREQAQLRADMHRLDAARADLQLQLAAAHAEQVPLVAHIKQLEATYAPLQAELRELQVQEQCLQADYQRLQSQREALAGALTSARAEIREHRARIERMSTSRWHRLGQRLGLKLESAAHLPPEPQ